VMTGLSVGKHAREPEGLDEMPGLGGTSLVQVNRKSGLLGRYCR